MQFTGCIIFIANPKMASIQIKCYKRRRSQPTQSAEKVASNEDLLTDILLRLPIRSVLHLKSVSKHWHSLITSPRFSLLRYSNHVSPSGLFLLTTLSGHGPEYDYILFDGEEISNPPFRALTFTPDYHGIRILQSCNGLLFCCSSRWPERCCKYYVYNPTTKQFTTIPPLPGKIRRINIFSIVLAFDPARSPHYEVICIRGSEQGRDLYQIVIYSSVTGPWRVSGQPFTAADINFWSGVYLDGAVHWTGRSDSTHHFWIVEERMETIPMPCDGNHYFVGHTCRSSSYFGASRGHLHHIRNCGRSTEFNVYEMEKNCTRWFVKYRVHLHEVYNLFLGPSSIYVDQVGWKGSEIKILRIVLGEREEDAFLVLEMRGKVLKYNLVEKAYTKLYDFVPGQRNSWAVGMPIALDFIESLSCV